MRAYHTDHEPSSVSRSLTVGRAYADQPGIAQLHALADGLMALFGPVFWAGLLVLLAQAALLGD